MALCSSSRSPVGLFSKHIQNDTSLHKDRLVSRKSASREGLRETAFKRGGLVEDEFTQFNDRQNPIPRFEQQQMILGLDVQYPSRGETKNHLLHTGWISEYSRAGGSLNGRSRAYHQSGDFAQATKHALPIQARRTAHTEKAVKQPRFISPAPQKAFQYRNPRGFYVSPMINDFRTKEAVHATELNDSDWEAAFSQLEHVDQPKELSLESEEVEQVQNGLVQISSGEPAFATVSETAISQAGTYYVFQKDNPFKSSHDPFLEGMEIINRNGSLTLAALAFEAATAENSTNGEAWRMLGMVLADSEQEGKASLALRKAKELGSSNPNLPLRLAICYTNQGNAQGACDILEEWLKSKYPQVAATAKLSTTDLQERYSYLKELYIRAAQLCPTGSNMDANVQIALGILFFSTREYEAAADCFAAAIACTTSISSQTDQLHLLYNHYGACLGNLSQQDEAISAYKLALEIKPNYTRARYNLGIAQLTQGNPKAGARSLVQRLRTEMMHIVPVGTSHGQLQEMSAVANEEDHEVMKDVHEGLRRCCYSMCRWDLAEKVGPCMDLRAFERQLDF